MRSARQRKIAPRGDWFSWLLPTLLCLILIICLISVASSTSFHAHAIDALGGRTSCIGERSIPSSYENGSSLCFSSWPGRALWQRFVQSEHDNPSTVNAVLISS